MGIINKIKRNFNPYELRNISDNNEKYILLNLEISSLSKNFLYLFLLPTKVLQGI